MPWRVVQTRKGQKDLAGVSRRDRESILADIDRLPVDPANLDFKKLVGKSNLWRLKVGRWRIIFRLEGEVLYLEAVLPRDEAYRR